MGANLGRTWGPIRCKSPGFADCISQNLIGATRAAKAAADLRAFLQSAKTACHRTAECETAVYPALTRALTLSAACMHQPQHDSSDLGLSPLGDAATGADVKQAFVQSRRPQTEKCETAVYPALTRALTVSAVCTYRPQHISDDLRLSPLANVATGTDVKQSW